MNKYGDPHFLFHLSVVFGHMLFHAKFFFKILLIICIKIHPVSIDPDSALTFLMFVHSEAHLVLKRLNSFPISNLQAARNANEEQQKPERAHRPGRVWSSYQKQFIPLLHTTWQDISNPDHAGFKSQWVHLQA